MRIAVIGTSGQLGFDLARVVPERQHDLIPFAGRAELDICDPAAITAMLDREKPDALINTAAFHNVDLCESQPEAAFRTNVVAVRDLAKACEARQIKFMQIGTDYVAEGWPVCKPIPEHAAVFPNSIYSASRFGGDSMTLAHATWNGFVVRSCGLFGIAGCKLKGGMNFIDSMIKSAREGKKLRVVNDQIVAPTPTDDLALVLVTMLETNRRERAYCPPGLYHAVSHGQTSWYEFAKTALELAKIPHEIEPVSSATYAAPARRPRYSVLDNVRLRAMGLDSLRDWREGLTRYIRAKYGNA